MRRAFAMELTRCRYIRSVLSVSCLAAALPTQDKVTVVDALYPGAVPLGGDPVLMRLVDDLTGEPIGCADAFFVAEHDAPIAGEFWWEERGTSDADGFVRVNRPRVKGANEVVVRHPTHGNVAVLHAEPVLRLGRTFKVPLRVLDWMGRPAPGAMVGLCGACGHSPDIVNAMADANGKAVLLDVDPRQEIADIYVQHPGLHFYYNSVTWRPGDDPMDVRCGRSIVQTGKVVDHLGAPVAGAFVCGGSRHRGPWARTAADGSFTILGAEPQDCPNKVKLASGREFHFGDASRYPVTIKLPALTDPEAYEATIDVPDRSAAAEAEVATKEVTVRVADAPSAKLAFDVDYPGQPERAEAASGPDVVEVPRAGPFVLVVHDDTDPVWNPRYFAFDEARRIGDELRVTWMADARVVARVVDPNGRPMAASVRWLRSAETATRGSGDKDESSEHPVVCADGRVDLTRRVGWSLIEFAPALPASGLRVRTMWVRVPAPDRTRPTLDLGDIVLGGPPQLRVVGADGEPIAGAEIGYARPGWQEPGECSKWPVDARGAWLGPDLHEGDCIVVQIDDASLPFRTVLQGAGPWTVVPPRGELRVQLVSPGLERVDGMVTVRDQYVDANGECTLRGLPTGPVRLFVGALGRRSAVVDAIVTNEPRTLRIELPPR